MPIQNPKESDDQTEEQEDGDEDEQEFIRTCISGAGIQYGCK